MLALRFAIGFLVQIVPCAALCVLPFSDKFKGSKHRAYALVAAVVLLSDVVFTLAGAGPLSLVPPDLSNTLQNLLFFTAIAILLGIFVRVVDASVFQKLFVFLIVMYYGYVSPQLSDAIIGFAGIESVDDHRLYDPGSLAVMAAAGTVLFVPMAFAMKMVKELFTMPLDRRAWAVMDVALCAIMAVLMVFELMPKYFFPVDGQDPFLAAALALFCSVFLVLTIFVARAAAEEIEKRRLLALAAMQRGREAVEKEGELARAHVRIAELEGVMAQLEEGVCAPGCVSEEADDAQEGEESVVFTTANGAVSFLVSDVMYAESLNRVRIVHLVGGESFKVNMSLAQIAEALPADRFVYCHRSVVVNLDCVRLLAEETLTLNDGTRVPVGRRRMREVRKEFERRAAERTSS